MCEICVRVKQMSMKLIIVLFIAGPEYGTTEAAWRAVLVEADRRCELHNRVKEDLNMKVNSQLKLWQKDTYHKVNINLIDKIKVQN